MLVLLHGFTGAPASWDGLDVGAALAPALAGHAPDLLGPWSWRQEIDRLAELLRPRAPVHLVGYSMGARVALGLACAHPDLVARATLVGVHPGLDEDGRAARARADGRWIRLLRLSIEAFVAAWEAQPLFATQARLSAPARARQRARRLGHDPGGLGHALAALGLSSMPDLRPELSRLRIPITLIAGALDAKFRALAAETAGALPRARVRLVAEAGHNVLLERPRALAALVEEKP